MLRQSANTKEIALACTLLRCALIRRLVVIKLWQARDAFDPEALMVKFEDGRSFD
jgi:hypothetical protein